MAARTLGAGSFAPSRFSRELLFLDASDKAGFRPAARRAFAGTVEQMAHGLIGRLEGTEEFDFMESIARPLPATVIGRQLGMDIEKQPDFLAWSEDLATFIGPRDPDAALKRRVSPLKMAGVFEAMLKRRRAQDADLSQPEQRDLIGHLQYAEADGRIEAGAELLAQCAMLIFAGNETTRNLLGNGLHALLSHPEQWQRLRQAPELLPNALRELLRYDRPAQYTGRRVTTDMMLHGRQLRRGDLVVAMIGAANRDTARFRNPDKLDITRREGSHLSFGHGPHVCTGSALTQIEAEIVFRASSPAAVQKVLLPLIIIIAIERRCRRTAQRQIHQRFT